MDVTNLIGRVGVVTGAGSGIGRATALALAERGADLAICDIDESGLKATAEQARAAGRHVLEKRVDVASAEDMAGFANRTFAELERVDVLVNNAGIGLAGGFLDVPLDEWNTILGINVKGVVHGCSFFAPRMVEAGRPAHIVNIASMAGYFAAPGMSAYCATKYAVIGLSEALRMELEPSGIGVTAICPGVINTPITRTSRMYGPDATEENRARGVRLYERRNYTPERVAKNILKAVQRNRAVAPVSPEAWIGYYAKRAFPGFTRWLAGAAYRRQLAGRGSS